jgi:hypothetical protein
MGLWLKADLHVLGASSGFYICGVVFHLSQNREDKGTYSNRSRFETAENIPSANRRMERPRKKAPNLSVLMTHSAMLRVIRGKIGEGQV